MEYVILPLGRAFGGRQAGVRAVPRGLSLSHGHHPARAVDCIGLIPLPPLQRWLTCVAGKRQRQQGGNGPKHALDSAIRLTLYGLAHPPHPQACRRHLITGLYHLPSALAWSLQQAWLSAFQTTSSGEGQPAPIYCALLHPLNGSPLWATKAPKGSQCTGTPSIMRSEG